MSERPILLVDGMNLFIRSYCAYPSMSSHGYQVGGAVGFLKTLRRIISETSPKAIYVAWESGGSPRRRGLYSEYKQNRKPEKLNRFYEDDIPDTDENKIQQVGILARLMKNVPICQIHVPDCEGDDVIAHLARYKFKDEHKIIVSSDKDFYQLLNDKTKIYSLHKKTFVEQSDAFEEYRIQPHNFALAKAICGDVSDNVPGVKGLGFKTLAKKIPLFGSENEIMLEDVMNFCRVHTKESTIFSKLLESEDLVKRNWQLVFLDSSAIAPVQVERLEHIINTFAPSTNKVGFIRQLVLEGITDFDVDGLFYSFLSIKYG